MVPTRPPSTNANGQALLDRRPNMTARRTNPAGPEIPGSARDGKPPSFFLCLASMETVFLLWHVHEVGDEDDDKLIGLYRTEDDARAAIERVRQLPGFADAPEG